MMDFGKSSGQVGRCFVCGKSTKLPIHGECGKKVEALRNEKTIKGTGGQMISPATRAKNSSNTAQKNYRSGKLPPFMFT